MRRPSEVFSLVLRAIRLARRAVDRHNRAVTRRRQRVFLLFQTVVSVGVFVLPGSVRADDSSEGRRHSQRASHLAAGGKCKQAIAEYDKAIAVLHDPALLFNRGECHRKLGDAEAALEDYNQFLADLPTAPNRAQVEARIAELRTAEPRTAEPRTAEPKKGAPTPAPSRPVSAAPVLAPGPTRPVPGSSPASSPESHKAFGARSGTAGGATSSGAAVALDSTRVPGGAAVDSVGTGNSLLFSNAEPSPQSTPTDGGADSLTSRPWFWIAIGAVAIAAGLGTYLILNDDGTSVPPSALGNFKF
jgi:hypothetical protein